MADEKYSAGARYERKAFRAYLRRQMKRSEAIGSTFSLMVFDGVNAWVGKRQERYDKKPGGLGKKSRG